MYDIRLCTPTKNTLVFAQDPPSVVLTGHVVFSLLQPLSLTAVSLSLVGTLRIRVAETFLSGTGQRLATVPSTSNTPLVTAHWDNLLSQAMGTMGPPTPTRQSSPLESSFLLHFTPDIPVGSTPFPQSSHAVYHLPQGNYSLPFQISLPSTIPESLITPNADIIYILKSTIHTMHPHAPVTAVKHINLMKTLTSLQLAQNEEYLAENAWSGKLQYKITMPQKNIPIGSNLHINLLIIPIIKGLKLGKLSFQIAQLTKLSPDFVDERIIYRQSFPNLQSNQLSNDSWALKVRLPVPNDLSVICPTTISNSPYYEVKHKLIVFINLINVDGHVSQIKSKILLNFYVSKNYKVFTKHCKIRDNDNMDNYQLYGKKLLFNYDDEFASPGDASGDSHPGPNYTRLPPELLIYPNAEFNSNEGQLANNNGDGNTENGNDFDFDEPTWDIPPSYKDSQNDLLFTNFEEFSANSNSSSLTSLRSNNSFQSSTNSNFSFNNLDLIPCYNKVYDDNLLTIGEPTPVYTKGYHDLNANCNSKSHPNIHASASANVNSNSNSSLRLNLLSRARSKSNPRPNSPTPSSNLALNNQPPRFFSYLNKAHNYSPPHTRSITHPLSHHAHYSDGDSSDNNSLINV